ncbi:MAG: TOMM precursor leader peptide-binding protein [Pseudonocardiaceae bacterium]|nr:TOMM precursor leader peptide-binding protein [Pseudonocardiaceae bacterium]
MTRTTEPPSTGSLPEWLRLAPGRSVLWRSRDCVQLGLADVHAMVLEGLSTPLATLLRSMDGTRSTTQLLADAVAAGAVLAELRAVLDELVSAGLATGVADPTAPTDTERAVDAQAWSLHSARRCPELMELRRNATVVIDGSTRLALAVATSLAAAGVGRVVVDPAGTVQPADVGIGYRLADVGLPRAQVARDALRRAVPAVRTTPPVRSCPDLVVLADALVPDPGLLLDLLARRVPHLAVHAHEGVAVVGPLVLPGRSSCLRCVQLRRADLDPAWPKLAAQLVSAVPIADVGCTQVAAALATEQVLAMLAGPSGGVGHPPTWGASLELDPLRGQLSRRRWPAHPRCGCGAPADDAIGSANDAPDRARSPCDAEPEPTRERIGS